MDTMGTWEPTLLQQKIRELFWGTLGTATKMAKSTTTGGIYGSVMGVGGGFHDDAVDASYSTKPDNQTTVMWPAHK